MKPIQLFCRRLGALCYDCIILVALWILGASIYLFFTKGQIPENRFLFMGYLLCIGVGFFVGFWVHGGQTLGMRAWRIKLQSVSGENCTWRQVIVRGVWVIVSWLFLGMGFLWMLVDPLHQTCYDRWARTQIVLA